VHALHVGEDTAMADRSNGSENALRLEWLKVQIGSTRARIPTRFESDIRADSALKLSPQKIQELYRQKELFRQHQLQQQHHHHKWISFLVGFLFLRFWLLLFLGWWWFDENDGGGLMREYCDERCLDEKEREVQGVTEYR
jgi:hypothetical protein